MSISLLDVDLLLLCSHFEKTKFIYFSKVIRISNVQRNGGVFQLIRSVPNSIDRTTFGSSKALLKDAMFGHNGSPENGTGRVDR